MSTQPRTAVMEITPELAVEWLADNHVNRSVRNRTVDLYAEAMRRREWLFTGEPIIRNGTRLLNGQHRLLACVLADTPFTSLVVFGVDEAAMVVMDSGKARTAGDAFTLAEVPNANMAAAAARLVVTYENGNMADPRNEPIRQDLVELATGPRSELLQESVSYGQQISRRLGMGAGRWAGLAFIVIDAGGEVGRAWVDGLASGVGLGVGDPRLALQSWALNRAAGAGKGGIRAPQTVYTGIKAWNASVEGRQLSKVQTWQTSNGPVVALRP